MTALLDALKSIPFFQHFDPHQLEELVSLGQFQPLDAEQVLFEQGDPADSLYVILKGRVKVTFMSAQGTPMELSTLKAGDFFGELALVDGGVRSATIQTLEACELFKLGREGFMQTLSRSPQLLSEVLADISDKIRTSNEKIYLEMLERQKIQAEMEIERHRSLSQMVAGVAHEVNTPLGIVNVTASMIAENLTPDLLERVQDEELRTVLDDILEASQLMLSNIARANKLIQTFKSISVSQITDTLEKVHLPALIQEILDLYKIKARQAGIVIKTIIDPALPFQDWTGYPGYLSQVLMNFLTNIERYAYPESGGNVIIELRAQGDQYQLKVKDFGQGMSEEDAARVFEVFFTTGRHKGGTGLGMSIVHNLVTSAMQGQISLESAPGQGTCVTVTLPHHIQPNQEIHA